MSDLEALGSNWYVSITKSFSLGLREPCKRKGRESKSQRVWRTLKKPRPSKSTSSKFLLTYRDYNRMYRTLSGLYQVFLNIMTSVLEIFMGFLSAQMSRYPFLMPPFVIFPFCLFVLFFPNELVLLYALLSLRTCLFSN